MKTFIAATLVTCLAFASAIAGPKTVMVSGTGSDLVAPTAAEFYPANPVPWANVSGIPASLSIFSGLTPSANTVPYFTSGTTAATTSLTSFGRSLIGDVDAATARGTLGLIIGTNVQAYDAGLQSISGLTGGANLGIYQTSADVYATFPLTSAGRALLDDADAAAQRATLSAAGTGVTNTFTGTNTFAGPLISGAANASAQLQVSPTQIVSTGTSANGSIQIIPKGTGSVTITDSDGGIGYYLNVNMAGVTANGPAGDIMANFSNRLLYGNWTGSGNLTVTGTTRFGSASASAALSVYAFGSSSTIIQSSGTGSDGNITISPKGNGNISLGPTGTGLGSFANISGGGFYVDGSDIYISGALGIPIIDVTNRTIDGNWTGSGNLTVTGTTRSVGPLNIGAANAASQLNITGNSITASGTSANVDVNIQSKGNGTVAIKAGGDLTLSVSPTAITMLDGAGITMMSNRSLQGPWTTETLAVNGALSVDKTWVGSGTTATQTINKNNGSINIAAAASSVTLINNRITATTPIQATLATNDSTMKGVVVQSFTGSAVFTPTTNPTGEVRINWFFAN